MKFNSICSRLPRRLQQNQPQKLLYVEERKCWACMVGSGEYCSFRVIQMQRNTKWTFIPEAVSICSQKQSEIGWCPSKENKITFMTPDDFIQQELYSKKKWNSVDLVYDTCHIHLNTNRLLPFIQIAAKRCDGKYLL